MHWNTGFPVYKMYRQFTKCTGFKYYILEVSTGTDAYMYLWASHFPNVVNESYHRGLGSMCTQFECNRTNNLGGVQAQTDWHSHTKQKSIPLQAWMDPLQWWTTVWEWIGGAPLHLASAHWSIVTQKHNTNTFLNGLICYSELCVFRFAF